jgi:hypothetical protein
LLYQQQRPLEARQIIFVAPATSDPNPVDVAGTGYRQQHSIDNARARLTRHVISL